MSLRGGHDNGLLTPCSRILSSISRSKKALKEPAEARRKQTSEGENNLALERRSLSNHTLPFAFKALGNLRQRWLLKVSAGRPLFSRPQSPDPSPQPQARAMVMPRAAQGMRCSPISEGAKHQLQQPGVLVRGQGQAAPATLGDRCLTLVDFFTVSALLSLLDVLAALGEFRPLERMSSLMGEVRPSGLAGCFLRPLRSVDIYPPTPEAGETGPQALLWAA